MMWIARDSDGAVWIFYGDRPALDTDRWGGGEVECNSLPRYPEDVAPAPGECLPVTLTVGEHACVVCGQRVEPARECYAIPHCYGCLPPPESLPVQSSVETFAKYRQALAKIKQYEDAAQPTPTPDTVEVPMPSCVCGHAWACHRVVGEERHGCDCLGYVPRPSAPAEVVGEVESEPKIYSVDRTSHRPMKQEDPPGTPVRVREDGGHFTETKTRGKPWEMAYGDWVVLLEDRAGAYLMERCKVPVTTEGESE